MPFLLVNKLTKESRLISTSSSVASLHASLWSAVQEGSLDLKETFGAAKKEWQFLSVSDYDRTIAMLDKKGYGLDAIPSRPLVDYWGNRFVIAYRKSAGEKFEVMAVSKGPDGTYATSDDVVSPWGEPVPPMVSGDKQPDQKE